MNCPAIRENLLVYLDGEATPEETRRIERHLRDCAACRSELGRMARLQTALHNHLQLLAEETAPSPEAWAAIQSRWKKRSSWKNRSSWENRSNWKEKERRMNYQPQNKARPVRVSRKNLAWSALLVVLLLIGLYGFVPEARAQAEQFIKRIVLGAYTSAIQTDPQSQAPGGAPPDDFWRVETEIGNFGGSAPAGQKPEVASFQTAEEARAKTNADILVPGVVPDGYALKGVRVAPAAKGPWSFLFYAGPGRDIIIVEMPVGRIPNTDPNHFDSGASGLITTDTLEEIDFDGRAAAWIAGNTLMWNDGEVSYQVGGLDLTLEQAKAIARSLR
jgi:hypothetical protein